jgi:hypothetical protein
MMFDARKKAIRPALLPALEQPATDRTGMAKVTPVMHPRGKAQ